MIMTGLFKRLFKAESERAAGGPFRFRVSDSVDVPIQGHLLRLKLLEGSPSIADLQPGRRVRLRAPDEAEDAGRVIEIQRFSETGGRPTQERLDAKRQLDVIVPDEAAESDGRPVEIGWFVEGPVSGSGA